MLRPERVSLEITAGHGCGVEFQAGAGAELDVSRAFAVSAEACGDS